LLWHGHRNIESEEITNSEEGFDMRFSKNGMEGVGLYFALNANYSCNP